MRKTWIACGWVVVVAGVVLVVTMGLAWLGGAEPFKMTSSITMGFLFILLGRTLIARGRSLRGHPRTDDSEAGRHDRAATRRMIMQAIWIGGSIVLAVGLAVGLLMVFTVR